VSPVRYELGFYIPEEAILHNHCRENLGSYIKRKLFVCPISCLLHSPFSHRRAVLRVALKYRRLHIRSAVHVSGSVTFGTVLYSPGAENL
jgi:hypothetical protein